MRIFSHPFIKKILRARNSSFFGIAISLFLLFFIGILSWGVHFLYTGNAFKLFLNGDLTAANFYFHRGEYYFNGGAYDIAKAEKNYLRSLALSGERFNPIHYQLGRIHFIQGNLSAATKEFNLELEGERSYKYFPDYRRAYYMRGLTYAYASRLSEAEADFKKHLEWHPTSWAGHNDLVWVYFRKGDYQNAEKYARSGLQYAPQNPWLHNALGTALLNLGKLEEAREHLQIAKREFDGMTAGRWGQAYSGAAPASYEAGLVAARAIVKKNIALVDQKLGSE